MVCYTIVPIVFYEFGKTQGEVLGGKSMYYNKLLFRGINIY